MDVKMGVDFININKNDFCVAILAGLSLGFAWCLPNQLPSAVLTWLAIIFIIRVVRRPNAIANIFVTGILYHLISAYWLQDTFVRIGSYSLLVSSSFFLLFAVASSILFLIFALLYQFLPKSLDRLALRGAVAWAVADVVVYKVFPWQLGHVQNIFPAYVQFADLFGVIGVSFLLFWTIESVFFLFRSTRQFIPIILSGSVTILILIYGHRQIQHYDALVNTATADDRFPIVLVQGFVDLKDKHDPEKVLINIEKHKQLSAPYDRTGYLVVWPETAMNTWIYDKVRHVRHDPRLPKLERASLIFGASTYLNSTGGYNSSLVVRANGSVGKPYHKRILVPFGEYKPFAKNLSFIKLVTDDSGSYFHGINSDLHFVTFENSAKYIRAAAFICYEDMLPELSNLAVLKGAELFVTQSNSAWFGDSKALDQHLLVASFRAIENKRFLLRATNTGLTAIVDPLGKVIAQLPSNSVGVLEGEIIKLSEKTLYSRLFNWPWYCLAFIAAVLCVVNVRKGHRVSLRSSE